MGFGKFGGGFGGGQMQQIMKQAQRMQEEMQKAQQELDEAEIEGVTAGGAVKVIVNGKKVMQSISIDPTVIDPEDHEMLEDLILAAYNDGCTQADEMYEEKMGAFNKMGGGMF